MAFPGFCLFYILNHVKIFCFNILNSNLLVFVYLVDTLIFSLIIAAPNMDAWDIAKELVPLLSYSAPFVIYHQYLQVIVSTNQDTPHMIHTSILCFVAIYLIFRLIPLNIGFTPLPRCADTVDFCPLIQLCYNFMHLVAFHDDSFSYLIKHYWSKYATDVYINFLKQNLSSYLGVTWMQIKWSPFSYYCSL